VINSSIGQVAEKKRLSSLFTFVKRLLKEKPLGTVGAAITLLLLLVGIFASFLAPYGMNESTADLLVGPSATHWFGTDNLGRDILSRVIYGARISVIVGLAASALSVITSTIIGMLSGYLGGIVDLVMQRFVDAVMSIPGIILMMVIISLIGPGMWQITIVLGLQLGIIGSRIVRSAVIGIRQNVYIDAAKAIGSSHSRMIFNHILPNILAPIIVLFSTVLPSVILIEASLSFLGYGIPAPAPSWGGMLSGNGRTYMFQAPWIVIWPGLALSIVVYGVNIFGDALRDLLDPRLTRGSGRYEVKSKRLPSDKLLRRSKQNVRKS
jgi:peptide/nickel transport system permease protein